MKKERRPGKSTIASAFDEWCSLPVGQSDDFIDWFAGEYGFILKDEECEFLWEDYE